MRPAEVGNRISLANEALLNVGSRIVLGSTTDIEAVEYLEADGEIYEFRPLERFGNSDAD
jgi:hypothetical protein|tara:strand:- start:244 stop:423 length:180 start_codon:yes stop_codon:yes gene_type:complete